MGKRLQQVSFLLAALGSDYRKNRDYLLSVFRGCQEPDCDEETAEFLIGLYEQGHHEVLGALLAAGLKSDAALSEALGPFYGEVLTKAPSAFLSGIRRLDASHQKAVCTLAGGGDGGGIMPETLEAGRRHLRRGGDDVGLRCLRDFETASREADEANRQ